MYSSPLIVRVRVRVQVQASRSDRVSKSCHSQSKQYRYPSCVSEVTVSEIKQHVPIHWIPVTDEIQIINLFQVIQCWVQFLNTSSPTSPGVRVRVRVLKISTRVGLEYTAGLEYYITAYYFVLLYPREFIIEYNVDNTQVNFCVLQNCDYFERPFCTFRA